MRKDTVWVRPSLMTLVDVVTATSIFSSRILLCLVFALMIAGAAPVRAQAIIDNGTIQLGVHEKGQLNVPGGVPSSGTGTTVVGLRYLPTGAESTSPGCLCEGWGVADAITGVTGYANESLGVANLDLISFTSTASSAKSIVQIAGAPRRSLHRHQPRLNEKIDNTFRVTHDYRTTISPNLYEAFVTIENISAADVDLRYRRFRDGPAGDRACNGERQTWF